jgi:uncharacterized membrane protein YhaH (DUF805 family)
MMTAKPQLTFKEALAEARGKLTQFNGRSRRSEFWWCALVVFIANYVLNIIPIFGSLAALVLNLLMIPLIFRRLHDSGHSGWWCGASMIVGGIYSAILMGSLFKEFIGIADGSEPDLSQILSSLTEVFTNHLALIFGLASFVLSIILLVFLLQDSKVEFNKYGESPKYVE